VSPKENPDERLREQSKEGTVSQPEAGVRLDVFLSGPAFGLSRSQAKILIEEGLVQINDKVQTKPSVPLRANQIVRVVIPPPRQLDLTPVKVDITILYEDDDLAVLEKPAGISVHPSETESGPTVVHGLLHDLKSLSSVGGVERPGIVHRIDKGTSGILVISKTDEAHLHLSQQFKEHSIERRYLALVYGDPGDKSGKEFGTIETLYGRSSSNRKKMTGKVSRGRNAVTKWAVEETYEIAQTKHSRFCLSLIECTLKTGRTHQIRVHLTEMGFSLVGDPLYGDHRSKAQALAEVSRSLGQACLALDHQMLHAYYLSFDHPVTKKRLEFESKLPLDFSEIIELAGG